MAWSDVAWGLLQVLDAYFTPFFEFDANQYW